MSAAHCIAIENATIVLENSYIFDGVLQIEEGKIVSFGTRGSLHIPPNATRIDANGCYLGPGLIDIHAHAGGEHPFAAEPVAAAQHMLRHGVTSVLATLYYELAPSDFVCAIDRINAAMDSGAAPNIKGFYMEGPYMNPRYGAFADQNQWKDQRSGNGDDRCRQRFLDGKHKTLACKRKPPGNISKAEKTQCGDGNAQNLTARIRHKQ